MDYLFGDCDRKSECFTPEQLARIPGKMSAFDALDKLRGIVGEDVDVTSDEAMDVMRAYYAHGCDEEVVHHELKAIGIEKEHKKWMCDYYAHLRNTKTDPVAFGVVYGPRHHIPMKTDAKLTNVLIDSCTFKGLLINDTEKVFVDCDDFDYPSFIFCNSRFGPIGQLGIDGSIVSVTIRGQRISFTLTKYEEAYTTITSVFNYGQYSTDEMVRNTIIKIINLWNCYTHTSF